MALCGSCNAGDGEIIRGRGLSRTRGAATLAGTYDVGRIWTFITFRLAH